MDQNKFQDFLKKTFEPTRKQYRQRARANQQSYRWLLWSITILSIFSAIAVSLEAFFDWVPLKVFAAVITIVVSGMAAALKSFGFQEKATLYSHHLNELENEWDLYQAGGAHYAEDEDPERYFVTRIRAFLSEWAKSMPNQTVPGDI